VSALRRCAPDAQNGARPPHAARLAGLDGLRGLAVVAVLLYHTGAALGGFLGVETFFVLSGYLITTLLAAEWARDGRIDLRGFWLRRARRLLPASWLLVFATLAYAVVALPEEVAGLRGAAAAGLLGVSNWHAVFVQQSYFEQVGRPPLLRHLWSLAVEWQFYAAWPPLLAVGLRRCPRRLAPLTLAAALGPAALMGLLFQPEADPSRLYYGTDTRASGLLLGSALGLAWRPGRPWGRASPAALDALGIAGLVGLGWLTLRMAEWDPWLYHGGFLAVGLLTAAVIASAIHPRTRLGRHVLAWQPLVWVGTRSYGIYLWHWPILMVTRPRLDVPIEGTPLLLAQLALIAVFAELSYRRVEMPARTSSVGSLRRVFVAKMGAATWQSGLRGAVAVATAVVLMGLFGTSVVTARPATPPAYLSFDTIGDADGGGVPDAVSSSSSLDDETPDDPVPLTPTPVPPTATTTAGAGASPPTATAPSSPTPAPSPAPTNTAASQAPRSFAHATAIGDSVMLGAVPALKAAIAGIDVDAAVSRQAFAGLELLRGRAASGQLGDAVVIHLGNNGAFTAQQVDQMMAVLAGTRRVVFVTVKVPRPWEAPNNAMLADEVGRFPNAVLADWHGASAGQPDFFWGDGIHLRPAGAAAYANLVAAALGMAPGA